MDNISRIINNLNPDFIVMLYRVPVLLVSFMVHEMSHGLAAYAFGDTTAKDAGRISFNPLRHIDPIGALLLIVVGFGWAKPLPINPFNFRRRKPGIIVTSLAGPFSNVLLAAVFYTVFIVFSVHGRPAPFIPVTGGAQIALELFRQFIIVNLSLAAFNLIPIPPLDGSKVLFAVFPDRIYYNYILRYERYGMIALIALSFTGYIGKIMSPIVMFLDGMIFKVVQPLAMLIIHLVPP